MSISKIVLKSFFILIILNLYACKKKDKDESTPVADFSMDKSQYIAGDVINLTNTSGNSDHWRWTLPDAQTSNGATVSYPSIKNTFLDQSLIFRLDAFSESGNKTDYVVKTVKIKADLGKLMIYHTKGNFSAMPIILIIDNGPEQYITVPRSDFPPACDQVGIPNFSLTIGTHTVDIAYNLGSWLNYTDTVQINPGSCTYVNVTNY